ncbi:MAG: bifunctional phosphopantothenoylcysteine decarboxylase/phosphopantothenate--cysteine ligase CoaBC [Rubrobacter sp.]
MILLSVGATFGALEAPKLARELAKTGQEVEVMLDEKARLFVGPSAFSAVGANVVERSSGAPAAVVHYPATTETVARLAKGLGPERETSSELHLIAPDIDEASAKNPAVVANVEVLRRDGCRVAGEAGQEIASARTVAAEVLGGLAALDGPFAGKRVVVATGGTHEPIDSVRFIGNRSSGKMGLAVAREARLLGAEVVVVAANIPEREPGVEWIPVEKVEELERAVHQAIAGADVLVMAAAVSDFTPTSPVEEKIRRGQSETMTLELKATSDVLAGVRRESPGLIIVGFAATHGDPIPDAREKLVKKGADFIVGNDISRRDIGFATEENEVVVVGPGIEHFIEKAAKSDVARAILYEVSREFR